MVETTSSRQCQHGVGLTKHKAQHWVYQSRGKNKVSPINPQSSQVLLQLQLIFSVLFWNDRNPAEHGAARGGISVGQNGIARVVMS